MSTSLSWALLPLFLVGCSGVINTPASSPGASGGQGESTTTSGNPAFVTYWKTNNAGTSGATQITLPLNSLYTYNFDVDWGDGTQDTITAWNQAEKTHTYAMAGEYEVSITGTFPSIYFNGGGDRRKILEVRNWGDIEWAIMNYAFYGCTNVQVTATDAPDLSQVTRVMYMFSEANAMNQDISHWDLSNITHMSGMFHLNTGFNQDISAWDVRNVTHMNDLFRNATAFNQDISSWNTSSVTSMQNAFRSATTFNQDLSSWSTVSVTNYANFATGATSWVLPQPTF